MEKEFDAWSPNEWKRPFESAEIPGADNVTKELSDDDWLSSGSLSKRARSTSVWAVGSTSIKSEDSVVTVTVVFPPASSRVMLRLTGTPESSSTSWTCGAKPVALTVK